MLDAELYLNLICGGAANLSRNRQRINDLNVFPIPDGDTGDNMFMTIEAGTHASGSSLTEMADSVARSMLLGARGNSGVILSRIFAGIAKGVKGRDKADMPTFCSAMQQAVDEAYSAVSQPVEGTILTVLREGVAGARDAATLEAYLDWWIAAMGTALEHTPEQLDVLKKAGVVDSGGAGLVCIAEGMRMALEGMHPVGDVGKASGASTMPCPDLNAFTEDSVLEYGYCTEFLLRLQRSKVNPDTFDERIIRDWLLTQGDSLVFFRDGSIVKVHVHTPDPGAVLSKCREWGEFLTVKVENMTLQHHENHMETRFKRSRKALGTVTVAAGKGLTETFKEMGADVIIEGGQTMNPPVERFLEAFDQAAADTILVFPNNGNILLTARQAAGLYKDARVEVIPTRTLGEGYFSLANLDAELPTDQLVQALSEAAASVTTGHICQAIRDTADARKGDYIGFSGKDILTAHPSRIQAAQDLAARLNAGGADILMLLQGAPVPSAEAAQLKSTLEKTYPRTEVILLDGGQPVYDYILVLC